MTHDLTLPLEPANCGSIHFLLTVSGSSIIAEEELTRGESQTISMEEMRNKYVSEFVGWWLCGHVSKLCYITSGI